MLDFSHSFQQIPPVAPQAGASGAEQKERYRYDHPWGIFRYVKLAAHGESGFADGMFEGFDRIPCIVTPCVFKDVKKLFEKAKTPELSQLVLSWWRQSHIKPFLNHVLKLPWGEATLFSTLLEESFQQRYWDTMQGDWPTTIIVSADPSVPVWYPSGLYELKREQPDGAAMHRRMFLLICNCARTFSMLIVPQLNVDSLFSRGGFAWAGERKDHIGGDSTKQIKIKLERVRIVSVFCYMRSPYEARTASIISCFGSIVRNRNGKFGLRTQSCSGGHPDWTDLRQSGLLSTSQHQFG